MLQRPQSLLLLLVAVCMVFFLGTETWHKTVGTESISLNAYNLSYEKAGSIVKNTPVYYLAVLAVLSAGLSIFTIFQYKNRVRQMLLVSLNSLVGAGLLGATVYQIQMDANKIFAPENQGEFSFSFWAAFVALALNWVANRLIRRDEKIVKDADRMR
jgi:glucan phosphoethanolaminetransferase (alkaline phosphatase superfamily)